jgi:hypothetical protein
VSYDLPPTPCLQIAVIDRQTGAELPSRVINFRFRALVSIHLPPTTAPPDGLYPPFTRLRCATAIVRVDAPAYRPVLGTFREGGLW